MKKLGLYIIFLCLLQYIYGQDVSQTIRKYTILDGLSNNNVNAIDQDRFGYLWLGTNDGLCRFNGYKFRIYKHDPVDTSTLSGNSITCLLISRNDDIWIGTRQNGLNKLNLYDESIIRYLHLNNNKKSISHKTINCLFEDTDGNIWIGTNGGGLSIFYIEKNEFVQLKHDPENAYSINNNYVYSIIEDRYHDIWIATAKNELNQYDKTSQNFKHVKLPANKNIEDLQYKKQIYEDEEGNFWLSISNKTIVLWDRLQNKFMEYSNNFTTINNIFEQGENLWLATDNGTFIMNKFSKKFSSVSYTNIILNDKTEKQFVSSIFIDNQNSIWICTKGDGFYYYNPQLKKYDYFSEDRQIYNHPVTSVSSISANEIWIGTEKNGVVIYNPHGSSFKKLNSTKINLLLQQSKITIILKENDENYWIGTSDNGLILFDKNNNSYNHYKHSNNKNNIRSNHISDICFLPNEKIAIALPGVGVDILDKKNNTFSHFSQNNNSENCLSSNEITALFTDSENNLWIGTNDGLNLFLPDSGTFKVFKSDPNNTNTINSNLITSIVEDKNKNIWIGTKKGGINVINKKNNKIFSYTVQNGLYENNIKYLKKDFYGNIWIVYKNCISKFEFENERFIHYTQDYKDNIIDYNFHCFDYAHEDNIFIGGDNGLFKINSSDLIINEHTPEIIISDVKIFLETYKNSNQFKKQNSLIQEIDEIKLKPNQNVFIIEFTAFDYLNTKGIRYAHKLEGIENEWIITNSSTRYGMYSNLPPKKYTFKIKASNSNGIWNDDVKTLNINIIPHFYQRPVFYILSFIILATLITFIVKYRVFRLSQSKKILEEKVKIRTIEIENQKSEIEAQRDEIELQKLALIDQKEKIEKQNTLLQQQHNELEQLVQERTKDLEEAKNKAEESDRLKTAFLTNLSHEIRTPMNAIIGFSSLLSDPEINDSQRNEFINHINHNSVSLLHMIDDIIDVSKIDSETIEIEKTICSLNVILVDLYSTYINYKTEIGKNHIDFKLNNPLKNENIKLLTDSYRLRQVFSHLLNNAFKYTEEGYVEFGVKKEKNVLTFYVKDTGIGIPKEKSSRIFDRFIKIDEDTSRQFRGTGIGLTLSKKLANLLGGEMWVDVDQEIGSVFYFSLPIIHKEKTEEKFDLLNVNWKDKNFLVAEDEKENYLLLQSILNKTKANIIHVQNGQQVINEMNNDHKFDIILMDLRMPVMDGIEATEKIRKFNSKIPIIGITAYTYSVEKEQLIKSGFSDIVTKPLKSNQFISLIMQYINKNDV